MSHATIKPRFFRRDPCLHLKQGCKPQIPQANVISNIPDKDNNKISQAKVNLRYLKRECTSNISNKSRPQISQALVTLKYFPRGELYDSNISGMCVQREYLRHG